MSEYIAKASIEPRDYRVVFLIQKEGGSIFAVALWLLMDIAFPICFNSFDYIQWHLLLMKLQKSKLLPSQ